jgi:hypothetical protein
LLQRANQTKHIINKNKSIINNIYHAAFHLQDPSSSRAWMQNLIISFASAIMVESMDTGTEIIGSDVQFCTWGLPAKADVPGPA